MKITKRFKKLFAMLFVLVVIIPLTSSFGVWDLLADSEDAYAGNDFMAEDTATEDGLVGDNDEETVIDTSTLNYKFSMGVEKDIYNEKAVVNFNGKTYYGVFDNNIKKTADNTSLKVGQLGTLDNPYVVLEITPTAAVSEIRPHVADLGFFDLTQEELDEIELTEDEKNVIRLQVLYQLQVTDFSKYVDAELEKLILELNGINSSIEAFEIKIASGELTDEEKAEMQNTIEELKAAKSQLENLRWKYQNNKSQYNVKDIVNDRPKDEYVGDTLTEIEEFVFENGFISEKEYDDYLDFKYKSALEYKRNYYRSITYNRLLTNNNYKYNLEYVTQYEVDENGNFAFYNDGENRVVETTDGTDNTKKAISNEYKTTTKMVNPLFLSSLLSHGNSNNKLLTHSNTFTKGCLDVAFDTEMSSTGMVTKQTPYIDEYVFLGWSVVVDGVTKNINTLDDDFSLVENGITELYTNWAVRYYEKDTYELLTGISYVPVEFLCEDETYTVMLPNCIASSQLAGIHDKRNQLTMCLAKKDKFLASWKGNEFRELYELSELSYCEEYSAWDFDFTTEKYQTVADIKKVAPKLMADTDYIIATKNIVHDVKTNTVTYYPYNVIVITITPEELNKMVYFDEAYNGKSSATVGYKQSTYLNKFLDSVDFVYFSNGGASVEYGGNTPFGTAKVYDTSFYTEVNINREPSVNKNPLLYTLKDNTLTYVEKNVVKSASYASNYDQIPDLEWQVVEKIYQRVAEPKDFAQSGKGQARSMVVIFNEALGDNVSGKAGAVSALVNKEGKYISGSADNLCKLMLMFFAYKDPTVLYNWYVNTEHKDSMNGATITFDKMKGIVRTIGSTEEIDFIGGTEGGTTEDEPVEGGTTESGKTTVLHYRGSYFTGSLYTYEQWNQALFLPYEYFDASFSQAYHIAALVDSGAHTASQMYKPENGSLYPNAPILYRRYGLAINTTFKNIANPYAYTYNGDTALAGNFYAYNIDEISNPSNGFEYGGNSDLAFEYFRRVKPMEIKNGKIATKSAIEFMVQNAHNSSVLIDKSITILNKAPEKTRMSFTGTNSTPYTLYIDTVFVEDFSLPAANVEYKYNNTEEGFFVPEILWTKQPSTIDNDYEDGMRWYTVFTLQDDSIATKWYVMPTDLDNVNKDNYYITYKITSTVDEANKTTVRTLTTTKALQYKDINGSEIETEHPGILAGSEYYFEALLKPIIDGTTYDQRTYMVAVKQYDDYQAYLDGDEPESIVVRNVILKKLTHLFNLD